MARDPLMLATALVCLIATTPQAGTWSIAVTDVEGLERLQTE